MSSIDIPSWAWWALGAVLVACLAIDLGAHRHGKKDSKRAAIYWSIGWIAVALAFNVGVFLLLGRQAGEEYLAAYLLEKSLSVDNLFVFLIIFNQLAISQEYQRRVLTWGILGALVTRGIFIFVGAAAVARWHWVLYIFGGILIIVGLKLLKTKDENEESKVLPFLERHLRYTNKVSGSHFFVVEAGRRVATPLLLALLAVEITDVIFAVDSIPAAFAVTREPFIIYSSNIFAILGLRSLYLVLAGTISGLKYLHFGLAAVLVFAGAKMLTAQWFHLPSWASLLVIIGCIGTSVVASLIHRRRHPEPPSPAAGSGRPAQV
ncbi:MAG TPA: TerC family protein [Myxococcaceae bacterium]|nr:TerC family protein [Myxococcaceae bacterium]